MKDIVIIGAGGFGSEVAWLIETINKKKLQWNILGFIDDDKSLQGKSYDGYKILGTIDYLKGKELNVAIAISKPSIRQKIHLKLKGTANYFPNLIHPLINLSKTVKIGEGVIVTAGTIITVNINIGNFVIIDRSCNIGHDTSINDFSTLLPSVTLSGNVIIKQNVLIGTGSTIIQNLTINENSILGAGAVVTGNIPSNCTAVGIPARPIKFHNN